MIKPSSSIKRHPHFSSRSTALRRSSVDRGVACHCRKNLFVRSSQSGQCNGSLARCSDRSTRRAPPLHTVSGDPSDFSRPGWRSLLERARRRLGRLSSVRAHERSDRRRHKAECIDAPQSGEVQARGASGRRIVAHQHFHAARRWFPPARFFNGHNPAVFHAEHQHHVPRRRAAANQEAGDGRRDRLRDVPQLGVSNSISGKLSHSALPTGDGFC